MRRGVTLVELLVVILIMLMITAVTLPAITPALEGRKIREGARMVEVYLNSARNRAIADNRIVGVKLEVDEKQPWICNAVSLVEQPNPWAGDYKSSKVLILGNGGFGAWSTYPPLAAPLNGLVAPVPPFTGNDVGWIGNIAPGDTFYLGANDMVLYRIYAGEPFIDVNGNGIWDQTSGSPGVPATNPSAINNEPFNDVDGNGIYTPPNPLTIDPDSGMFIGLGGVWPQVKWSFASAFITYTFADPVAAAAAMHPFGCQINSSGAPMGTPITLNTGGSQFLIANPLKYAISAPPKSVMSPTVPPSSLPHEYAFSFNRRPVPLSTPGVSLPAGVVIDMGVNFLPGGGTNIAAAPGSGIDMISASSATKGYIGNFASFRPNPICDPSINTAPTTSARARFNRSIIISFNTNGVVYRVYSWDERHFLPSTTPPAPLPPISSAIPNYSDYRGRLASSPVYLLIGRQELAGGDPEAVGNLTSGLAPVKPAFNVQDPSSLWIAIQPRTGMITTSENVAPDLSIAPPGTTAAQLQLYLNRQTYDARRIAREGSDMGGM